jgi:hypothetical protein
MIDLSQATLLGQGNGRNCYVHPLEPALVIKVRRLDRRSRDQNRSELLYLSSLVRRRVPFDHIPQLHGPVCTTLGEGLVCERIANPDGSPAPSLAETVRQGVLSGERANALLDGLLAYLPRHWVVYADAEQRNLAWQQRPDGAGRLVILDGLGARCPGLKMWLLSHVPFLARRKTRKHWPRLLEKVRKGRP